jgi:hypothetical protein
MYLFELESVDKLLSVIERIDTEIRFFDELLSNADIDSLSEIITNIEASAEYFYIGQTKDAIIKDLMLFLELSPVNFQYLRLVRVIVEGRKDFFEKLFARYFMRDRDNYMEQVEKSYGFGSYLDYEKLKPARFVSYDDDGNLKIALEDADHDYTIFLIHKHILLNSASSRYLLHLLKVELDINYDALETYNKTALLLNELGKQSPHIQIHLEYPSRLIFYIMRNDYEAVATFEIEPSIQCI